MFAIVYMLMFSASEYKSEFRFDWDWICFLIAQTNLCNL